MTWKEMQVLYERVPKFTNDKNPLGLDVPEEDGLYLIGSTYFNPCEPTEKLYFIKVGQASNLRNRMKKYRTDNPAVFNIAFDVGMSALETMCHSILLQKCLALREGTLEWFLVDEQTYTDICAEGFKWFYKEIVK